MKKLLLTLLCLPFIGFRQKTFVPDGNFEAYLEHNAMGDGILNDSVLTSNIINVSFLSLSSKSISDLTGIEDFVNLEIFKVTDLLGRETKQKYQPLFYIYDDGTLDKRIVID